MKRLEDLLKKYLPPSGLDAAIEKFRLLRDELKKRNETMNLTSITDDDGIEIKHFMDSLSALAAGIKNEDSLVDIGSGGGFPALPLKIVLPSLNLAVVEATLKKAAFIEDAVGLLGLSGVKVYGSRSEELPACLRDSFDWATARALAKPPAAAELMLPWVRVGGKCLLYAASSAKSSDLARVCEAMGGKVAAEIEYALPPEPSQDNEELRARKIIIVAKTRPSPAGYPRRPGIAAKDPMV